MTDIRRATLDANAELRWDQVELLRYKEEPKDGSAAPFKDITRQVLFAQADQACELRYFEVAAGGHSTLERHQHTHAVLILRGKGSVRLSGEVHAIQERDLVTVSPMTWHQFLADQGSPLGFLCLVSKERDKPQLPTAEQAAEMNVTQP